MMSLKLTLSILLFIQLENTMAFLPPSTGRTQLFTSQTNNNKNVVVSIRTTERSALVDPNNIIHTVSQVTQATAGHHSDNNALSTLFSTMYTATLPPLDPDANSAISTMKDYFIPTTSEEATRKALESFVQSQQQNGGATLPNSSDLIRFDKLMPGAQGVTNPAVQPAQYTYKPKIDKEELNWIAQQFDIFQRKIPFVVTLYALLDFFVLPKGPDVLSDELEDDRMAVVQEWVSGAVSKLGVISILVIGIIFVENLTYHPV